MRKVTVALPERRYDIVIAERLLSDKDCLRPLIRGGQVCIVTNDTVARWYLEPVKSLLSDLQLEVVILPDGEAHKNLDTLNMIFDQLLAARHHRTTTLIALGGGVIGDMTGFAAASYQRGVDFIQVPTTLLSQVDSSVGGKTGVNHKLGKNMIGAFYQPRGVVIDLDVLKTLPPRELAAGLAEVIKYGLIADADFYRWLESNMDALVSLEPALLAQAVERSCQIKADIVSRDERESGVRAWLNLGHTFGHAIENDQGYGVWLHGEAVAVGMLMAMDLSVRLGWLAAAEIPRLRTLLQRAGLPVQPPAMNTERFLTLMAGDKKVLDGRLRLVLLRSIGRAEVTDEFPQELLLETLSTAS